MNNIHRQRRNRQYGKKQTNEYKKIEKKNKLCANCVAEFPSKPDLGEAAERVHRSRIHDVNQLKSRLIEEREDFHQVFIAEAIRQWRPRLPACVRAHGWHFEHIL